MIDAAVVEALNYKIWHHWNLEQHEQHLQSFMKTKQPVLKYIKGGGRGGTRTDSMHHPTSFA
jgi:hypothetical protein